jgi:hypothetical protein
MDGEDARQGVVKERNLKQANLGEVRPIT